MDSGKVKLPYLQANCDGTESHAVEIRAPLQCVMLLLFLLGLPHWCSAQSLDKYLHKNANLGPNPPSELFRHSAQRPISPRQAALFAVKHLKARGVADIRICEASWIAAPLSGYLVDAKGRAIIHEVSYSQFRVGIRDGLEEKDGKLSAGEVFVFIALGKEKSGRLVWYPSSGPDYRLAQGETFTEEMLAYEFLLYREQFESLTARYP